LRRASSAADSYRGELSNKIRFMKSAVLSSSDAHSNLTADINSIDQRLKQVDITMNGDASIARREFETAPSINGRISTIEFTLWNSTSAPTQTAMQSFDVASKQFTAALTELKSIDGKIKEAEVALEGSKAPYTPGRFPEWKEGK
jgi:hypothetical protein